MKAVRASFILTHLQWICSKFDKDGNERQLQQLQSRQFLKEKWYPISDERSNGKSRRDSYAIVDCIRV